MAGDGCPAAAGGPGAHATVERACKHAASHAQGCGGAGAHCSGSNFLPRAKRDIRVLMGRSAVEMMTYTEPGM
jgi:hypothetical protein|eukprot:COSAG01_NODE_10005_length_2276_cov_29.906293_1_plen_73_part_00